MIHLEQAELEVFEKWLPRAFGGSPAGTAFVAQLNAE